MANTQTQRATGSPLPDELRASLAEFVRAHGEEKAIESLGLSRITLARAMAGLGLRRGTIVLVRVGLQNVQLPSGQSAA